MHPSDGCSLGLIPRCHLSVYAGPRSSGRTTLVLQTMAASTRRGDIAALVDTSDRLDVASAAEAGIDLGRLLWIRGLSHLQSSNVNLTIADLKIAHALKALNLVLQA